jgi:hypothetical protein
MALTVTAITPTVGPNNTNKASITNLAGTGFVATPTVKITKAGESDINATNVVLVTTIKLTCDFNLTGATAGDWTVRVTNPDTSYAELTDGFAVKIGGCKGCDAGNKQPKLVRTAKVMPANVGGGPIRPTSGQMFPRSM